jgi:SAM-dependent methyltransferase
LSVKREKSIRTFDWISSVDGDEDRLKKLHAAMAQFYSRESDRAPYQEMLNAQDEAPRVADSPAAFLLDHIRTADPGRVLEVGCGNGRLYRQLRASSYCGMYSGVEVAGHVIAQNRSSHPDAEWRVGEAYELPFPDGAFDLCFAFYVLEHLVWPERALREMLRVVHPKGRLALVFPDFVESGYMPSQLTGYTPGSARVKLRARRWIDALVGLYDSRLRMPLALAAGSRRVGRFPVNMRPLCLSFPELMWPDIDAVYIASKEEIHRWAINNGFKADFPAGRNGTFALHSFISIEKV